MAEVEDLEVQTLEYQSVEESLEDKDSEIFDTILLNNVEARKSKLKILQGQGIDTHIVCYLLNKLVFNRSDLENLFGIVTKILGHIMKYFGV